MTYRYCPIVKALRRNSREETPESSHNLINRQNISAQKVKFREIWLCYWEGETFIMEWKYFAYNKV